MATLRAQLSALFDRRNLLQVLLMFAVSLCAQIFFIVLTLSSLQDYSERTHAELIAANASMTAQKLTTVAMLGRRVENYRAAQQDLYELQLTSGSPDAFITNPRGRILLGQSSHGLSQVDLALLNADTVSAGAVEYKAKPYYDSHGLLQGYVVVSTELSPERHKRTLPAAFYQYCAAAALGSLLLFFAALALAPRFNFSPFKRKLFTLMLPFMLGQLITAAAAAPQLFNLAFDYAKNLEFTVSASLANQFKEIKAQDILLEDISGYGRYFAALKADLPAAGGLAVTTADEMLIEGDESALSGSVLPVFSDKRLLGHICVAASAEVVSKLALDMLLKLGSLFIISFVLAYELSSLLELEFARSRTQAELRVIAPAPAALKLPYEPELIRPLSFLAILALYLPITIVPVKMAEFAGDFPGLPLELVQSFAVCTEMVSIAASSFYILLTKPYPGRWKVLGRNSFILLACAACLAMLSPNAYCYLASRMLYGLGYGALLAFCQLFALGVSSEKNRGVSMASLSAGLYSGVLCSAAAGGIIADNLGFKAAFAASALLFVLLFTLFAWLNHHRALETGLNAGTAALEAKGKLSESRASFAQILALLKDGRVLSLLLLQALPYSMIGIGFFNYLLPISFAEHNLGASALGQLNFVYAFIIILSAPLCGRLFDRLGAKSWIVLSVSLIASALVPTMFNLPNFLAAAFLVIVLLGISAALSEGGQPAFISKLSSPLGESAAQTSVLLLDSVLRIGQSIGPLLLALLITWYNSRAFGVLSAVIIACALIFIVLQIMLGARAQRRKAADSRTAGSSRN